MTCGRGSGFSVKVTVDGAVRTVDPPPGVVVITAPAGLVITAPPVDRVVVVKAGADQPAAVNQVVI
jgi:hypothetical protein